MPIGATRQSLTTLFKPNNFLKFYNLFFPLNLVNMNYPHFLKHKLN